MAAAAISKREKAKEHVECLDLEVLLQVIIVSLEIQKMKTFL